MKLRKIAGISTLFLAGAMMLGSCQDELSTIGGSLAGGEVSITIDSLHFELNPSCYVDNNYDSRDSTNLIGRFNVPEYGELNCSFVSRLMCAASLPVPDSIPASRVDSIKILFNVPRGQLTGDSLAPQQLKVYRLTKQLPNDIDNSFDPTGYYDESSLLGSVSYTLSALGLNDSTFAKKKNITIPVSLPRQFGEDLITAYREHPEIFEWPQTFAKYFPGIYVKPSFGSGCVANVASTRFMTWYYHKENKVVLGGGEDNGKEIHVADSVALLGSAPEVLSSNNISYKISDNLHNLANAGKILVTTPGGYRAKFKMPVAEILDKYTSSTSNLQVITQMSLSIPAKPVENEFGLTVAPSLLLVPTHEVEEFFNERKVPDAKRSFYADYSETEKKYIFRGMREYIVAMSEKGTWTDEDTDYTLVPVLLKKETVSQGAQSLTQIMACMPYMLRPTMAELDMEKAMIVFTYSDQTLE